MIHHIILLRDVEPNKPADLENLESSRKGDIMQQATVDILMVDDRPENLLALEAVLESASYRLISLTSGEAALRYVLQADVKRLALILMDVHMPDMDGYETASLIRERKDLRNVPIIFITATYKSKTNVRQGYLNGSIDYIFKPFDPDVLRWKVENFVQLHSYQHDASVKNARLQQQYQELESVNERLRRAERQLLEHREALERMVEARTQQLQEANREILQSHERFRTIFQSIPNLLAIRRMQDGRFLEINRSWEQTTGYSLEQMQDLGDRALQIVFTEQDEDAEMRKISFSSRSGELRSGLLSMDRLEAIGEAYQLIVITDITEREVMQKHLNHLERLNLIGEMAAGIAHEIRNPMTTIHGFLQMWRKSEAPLPKTHIDLMLSELLRANTIITEYLALAGNKQSHFEYHSISDLIDSLQPLLHAFAVMSELQVIADHESLPLLFMDEKEIRQLIVNLAKNGLEAMKPGGILTIRSYRQGEEAIVDIIDQGEGIPEELLSKLGTPFFTTKETGTGLGLALCYSIVERHRGKLLVQTGAGGTTFSIRLPIAAAVAIVQ